MPEENTRHRIASNRSPPDSVRGTRDLTLMKTTGCSLLMVLALGALLPGCSPGDPSSRAPLHSNNRSTNPNPTSLIPPVAPDPCALVLTRHQGEGELDHEIRRLQLDVPAA